MFLSVPSFQGNSQRILDCILSLWVVGRCSSGCSKGLWCKYPNAFLELMSKNIQSLQILKPKKLLMATTAIYTPAELCNAHGTYPSISHRSFYQSSEASRTDIITILISQVDMGCPRGGAGVWTLTIRPRDLSRIPKHTINLKEIFFSFQK